MAKWWYEVQKGRDNEILKVDKIGKTRKCPQWWYCTMRLELKQIQNKFHTKNFWNVHTKLVIKCFLFRRSKIVYTSLELTKY